MNRTCKNIDFVHAHDEANDGKDDLNSGLKKIGKSVLVEMFFREEQKNETPVKKRERKLERMKNKREKKKESKKERKKERKKRRNEGK